MNTQIENMLAEAENRYLAPQELRTLQSYFTTFEQRAQAMSAIEAKEEAIVHEVIDVVFERHPDFSNQYHQARVRCIRDVTLTLRYCAQAMLRDDPDFLKEKYLYWLRTILHAFRFNEVIDTTYRQLVEKTKAHIDAEQFRLVEPYLTLTHNILTTEN